MYGTHNTPKKVYLIFFLFYLSLFFALRCIYLSFGITFFRGPCVVPLQTGGEPGGHGPPSCSLTWWRGSPLESSPSPRAWPRPPPNFGMAVACGLIPESAKELACRVNRSGFGLVCLKSLLTKQTRNPPCPSNPLSKRPPGPFTRPVEQHQESNTSSSWWDIFKSVCVTF